MIVELKRQLAEQDERAAALAVNFRLQIVLNCDVDYDCYYDCC
jgi:hypothetical protein